MSEGIAPVGRLLLLGGGNMGGAMLRGWMERGLDPASVTILDPNPSPALGPFSIAACGTPPRRRPSRRTS